MAGASGVGGSSQSASLAGSVADGLMQLTDDDDKKKVAPGNSNVSGSSLNADVDITRQLHQYAGNKAHSVYEMA